MIGKKSLGKGFLNLEKMPYIGSGMIKTCKTGTTGIKGGKIILEPG
jgi:hypothetical protein